MDPAPKLDPATETALRTMHDIVQPAPVLWLPQTWGWAALAALLVTALVASVVVKIRRYRHDAYRREAIRQLDRATLQLAHAATRDEALRSVPEILKRTMIAAWPREQVASLSAADFLAFLGRTGAHDNGALRGLLDDAEYRRVSSLSDDEATATVSSARQWIERHHVSA
ncbi:DUF4381 domain-containing protein [Rhizobium sp. GCM10022189]|uniref:DUF4381 domain-containing protein n=1 Tax=Rhizobium sp. GCM10022189 TaxID=3252654 RepID=UPI003618E3FC